MPQNANSPEQLMDRSAANGYKPGDFEPRDGVSDMTIYVEKTRYNRICVLRQHQ